MQRPHDRNGMFFVHFFELFVISVVGGLLLIFHVFRPLKMQLSVCWSRTCVTDPPVHLGVFFCTRKAASVISKVIFNR